MSNDTLSKQPHFYLSLQQVRDSHLLSPERMAEVEAEIERRISIPQDAQGRPIETARLADLSPWPRYLYPRMEHDHQWEYLRREILAVVLTESERELLNRNALRASSARRDEEQFERATKIPASQWDGWVTNGDNYWSDVWAYLDEVDDRAEDGEEPFQHRYLWAAKPHTVIDGLDVERVVESRIEAWGWDDMSASDLKGVAELQKALDAFVEANREIRSYLPDYTIAVVLEPRLAATNDSI